MKSNPKKNLRAERLPCGCRRLCADLERCARLFDGTAIKVCVPAGFVTDFSSIPRGLRWIVQWSRVDIAGVVHDWLYRMPCKGGRHQADAIWRQLARSGRHRANYVQALLGRVGLCLVGWCYYDPRDPKDPGFKTCSSGEPHEIPRPCDEAAV
jgi:hypothetical protein